MKVATLYRTKELRVQKKSYKGIQYKFHGKKKSIKSSNAKDLVNIWSKKGKSEKIRMSIPASVMIINESIINNKSIINLGIGDSLDFSFCTHKKGTFKGTNYTVHPK